MADADHPTSPSLPWRVGSSIVMGVAGAISRTFLFGLNRTHVHGLDDFLEVLNGRAEVERRGRGLITGTRHANSSELNHVNLTDTPFPVSNHVSVYVRNPVFIVSGQSLKIQY